MSLLPKQPELDCPGHLQYGLPRGVEPTGAAGPNPEMGSLEEAVGGAEFPTVIAATIISILASAELEAC